MTDIPFLPRAEDDPALTAERDALRGAALAFNERFEKWIMARSADTKLGTALAFGLEYEALLDAARLGKETT